jgi:hypothetical protein
MHHRDIGDLMRYAAMNQDGDIISRYENFVPLGAFPLMLGKVPENPAKFTSGRYGLTGSGYRRTSTFRALGARATRTANRAYRAEFDASATASRASGHEI